MGLLDDILSQQSGGGMLGGLPATWQYANPESLSPAEKKMMAMVGTQNPDQVGFAPLPPSNAAFPVNGAAPVTGVGSAGLGDASGAPAPTIGAPPPSNVNAFNGGAAPAIFVNPPGSTPGNPALPPPASAPAPAANDDEDTPPAANAPASPVAIGNYQMPRIGNAGQFAGDPAALPANARPTQGVGAPGQDTEPGFMTGYQNFRHGGGLIGSIVAAVTGRRNDDTAVAQQQQTQIANVTARALVNKGVPQDVALAAVQPGNTELLRQLVTQAFSGPKAPTVLGNGYIYNNDSHKVERAYEPDSKRTFTSYKRPDGSEVPGVFDPDGNDGKGSFTPISGAAPAEAPVGIPGDMNKTGAEYISTIPDVMKRKTVEGLVDGTAQIPRITTKNQQQWEELFAMAKQADPTFDSALYAQRVAGRKDFMGGGKSAEMVRSANQTIGHVADLVAKADALHNRSFTPWNYVTNTANSVMGDDASGNWVTNAHAVADEIGKLFKGNNLSDTEIKQWAENLTPNMSPQQQRGAVKNLMGLLEHSVDALEDKRLSSIGPMAAEKAGPLLTNRSRELLEHVKNWTDGKSAADAGLPALKVGETATVGGVAIKKVSDK